MKLQHISGAESRYCAGLGRLEKTLLGCGRAVVCFGMLRVYAYKGCGTCRKALKWLDDKGVDYETLAVRETPPSLMELEKGVEAYGGDLRKLFNTSGLDYRAMDLKSRLPSLSRKEALELLSKNGNLVKRPFAVGKQGVKAGFNPEEWSDWLGV